MVELTGAEDAVAAWRSFFEPGEVVAIKVNPVGNPLAISSPELMLAVIDGLKAAGVKPKDIVRLRALPLRVHQRRVCTTPSPRASPGAA